MYILYLMERDYKSILKKRIVRQTSERSTTFTLPTLVKLHFRVGLKSEEQKIGWKHGREGGKGLTVQIQREAPRVGNSASHRQDIRTTWRVGDLRERAVCSGSSLVFRQPLCQKKCHINFNITYVNRKKIIQINKGSTILQKSKTATIRHNFN